jgi:C4-type Zn-finger protein
MPAIAEVPSTRVPRLSPRGSNQRGVDRTTCPVCADSMVAAEASAFISESQVNYLWTCDTCGYGFVTSHSLKRYAAA